MTDKPKRLVDRIFDPSYLDALTALPIDGIRVRRTECEELESELSYSRRLLQGKIDILNAALKRRAAGGQVALESLIHKLPTILADEGEPSSLKRHTRIVFPPNAERHRRDIERLAAGLANIDQLSEDELSDMVDSLSEAEVKISDQRRRVQEVMDELNAELVRRYREGQEDPNALLTS